MGVLLIRELLALLATAVATAATAAATAASATDAAAAAAAAASAPRTRRLGGPILVRFLAPLEQHICNYHACMSVMLFMFWWAPSLWRPTPRLLSN